MSKPFCYSASIPADFALAVLSILRGNDVEDKFDALSQYDPLDIEIWMDSIIEDNFEHLPAPMQVLSWWKAKIIGN